MRKSVIYFALLLLVVHSLSAQQPTKRSFLAPADSLHNGRLWTSIGIGTAVYTGASIGLYHAWYKDFDLIGFHTFNDMGEWNDMDKMGHLFTTQIESIAVFNGALWTGMDRKSAMWTGAGVGMLLQTTIEIMDAFSAEWGFSWGDMAFNTLGAGLFVGQELAWQEQRILMKVSNNFPDYPEFPVFSLDGNEQTTLALRAESLFGTSSPERFLKDYNGQTIWASFNIHSFLPATQKSTTKFPKWLNLGVGYGSENMFGGYENAWEDDNGVRFELGEGQFPRYRQFYLSFDVDLTRLGVKNRFLRFLFSTINWIKIPGPTLEFNTLGGIKFHPFYW